MAESTPSRGLTGGEKEQGEPMLAIMAMEEDASPSRCGESGVLPVFRLQTFLNLLAIGLCPNVVSSSGNNTTRVFSDLLELGLLELCVS